MLRSAARRSCTDHLRTRIHPKFTPNSGLRKFAMAVRISCHNSSRPTPVLAEYRKTHFEKVNGLSAPWRGTGFRDFCPKQGIDDAGFADVGTPQKRDFGQVRFREVANVGCRQQKSRQDTHKLVWR